jgi:hypothetical protein
MALIECKECAHTISKNAESCPNCGAPLKRKKGRIGCGTFLLLIIVGLYFIGKFSSNDSSVTTDNKTYNEINTATSTTNTTTPAVPRDLRYAHTTINIRAGAGKSHKVVGKLYRGDVVEVKSVENWWAKISVDGIDKGYVFERLLQYDPVPSLEIASWNWYKDPDFGTDGAVIWNVEVRNNTNQYIDLVRVEFSTYDSSNRLITSEFTYVRGLSPGGSGTAQSYATYYGREKTGRIRIAE